MNGALLYYIFTAKLQITLKKISKFKKKSLTRKFESNQFITRTEPTRLYPYLGHDSSTRCRQFDQFGNDSNLAYLLRDLANSKLVGFIWVLI